MGESQSRIRAAIIGFGVSGELSHAYGLQANPQFEIVAVCDLSPERRERAANEIGCPTFDDHQTLLREVPDLDLACIVTRSDTHRKVACDFLQAGVNILITKPWALDSAEARTIIKAQEQSGKAVFPWLPMYWSPEYATILRLVEENAIGRVFLIRRAITQFRRRSDWQTQLRFGGGYLLNWGSHIVQPVLSLAASPLKRVFGQLQQVINPGDGEDNFLAVLEFENGTRGVAEFTQASEGLPSFMVQGDAGMIRSDGKEIVLIQKDPDTNDVPRETIYPIEGKLFGDEADIYRDVARTLREGHPFPASVRDAYYGTLALDAIRASHRLNEVVAFDQAHEYIQI